MNAALRYLKAFAAAVRMTMRGETPAPSPDAPLLAWMKRTAELAEAAVGAADAAGLDRDARRQRTLTAEGRRTTMETILASIRFHATDEYPHLIASRTQASIAAIYATNVNDRFLAAKLFDTLENGPVREAVGQLVSHLDAIPPTAVHEE